MKIVFAGRTVEGTSSLQRLWALRRLGHEVVVFDPEPYQPANALMRKVAFRLANGPDALRLNRDLRAVLERERPDVLWVEKILSLQPGTLRLARKLGALSVSYMIDNAYGPRRDAGFRMYNRCVPWFDLHVTQRDVSMEHYRQRGARDVMKVQTAYEPTVHFPSPVAITDAERTREVSFIGTPYDDRADVLAAIAEAGVPLTISGSPRQWGRALKPEMFAKIFRQGELWEDEYREAIWRSKINLSFLTKSNQDEYTHKSFEIAGCGGFLLAERCVGHELKFREDEEAVFFTDTADLVAKIQRWLPDEAGRARIAAAGCERARRDGYHNDRQMGSIVERLEQIAAAKKGEAA